MTATKQQELETLAKIKKMVDELGEDSYIGAAFEGCFELAEKNINEDAAYSMKEHSAYLTRCEAAKELEKKEEEIKSLKAQLEAEQEWKPYIDTANASQEEYQELAEASGTEVLTEGKAKELLYDWFGFAREKITIIKEVSIYEVNRHHRLRKISNHQREALYNASDWNYIRFNCGCMMYELRNGEIKVFED